MTCESSQFSCDNGRYDIFAYSFVNLLDDLILDMDKAYHLPFLLHIPSPYCWTVRGEPGLIIRWSSVPRYLRRKLLRAGIFPSKRGRRGQERSGDIWDWEGTFVEDSSSETEDPSETD